MIMLPNQVNQQNNIVPPSSLQSALQMDPNQHLQLQQQQQQQAQPPTPTAGKRRKRAEGNDEDAPAASEPRRLRRSHEACARCRSKKIKCDSKHPRCTACATAGTACNQEDRHRRTLTPRGYTERLELQLAQCEALLKRQYPGFTLDNLDDILAREGIEVGGIPPIAPNSSFQIEGGMRPPFRPDAGPPPSHPSPPKGYPPMYPPGPPMMPPYPHPMMPYGPAPPYHQMMQGPPGAYNPHIHPAFQPGAPYPPPPPVMHQHPPPPDQAAQAPPQPGPPTMTSPIMQTIPATKGTDPNGHDMSNPQALAKNFGVSAAITSTLHLDAVNEELPVDPTTLPKLEIHGPRDPAHWISVSIRRNPPSGGTPNTLSLYGPTSKSPQVDIWLPKDRNFAQYIVDVYFKNLNLHRPVYSRKDFDRILNDLYESATPVYDPGHLCSIYLIFALGTLSELNQRAVNKASEKDHLGTAVAKRLMPSNWPVHDEFFERALVVKPDLRVSLSSLQALILLHWYLYIERQGRTLWRLAGTLVRLSIELGLHHDPTTQIAPDTNTHIFTEDESQLRIRLWAIVMVHDRGTSILLGRPLAIAPSDSNTPQPTRSKNKLFVDFSEHFEVSSPVADIQADIINSLYAPTRQAGDTIMRNATRIIKSMVGFRSNLPEKYQHYFTGTGEWPMDKRQKLVQDISEDLGLTLLKIGIARILMLRALFSSKELSYDQKHKALMDAIITAHNIIVIHSQLIKYPNIAFFTSPIPLHIAAMVILYGHISKVECLPPATALEDVWFALDMIPRFRWRWERKDVNGGHPLIAKLVEHVMGVNLHTVVPHNKSILIPELDWDENKSPTSAKSQHSTPTLSSAPAGYNTAATNNAYGPHSRSINGLGGANPMNRSNSGGSTPPDNKQLVDMPDKLFYPFFPEAQVATMPAVPVPGTANPSVPTPTNGQDYTQLLKTVAAAQGEYGPQAYSDERNAAEAQQEMVWMSNMVRHTYFATS
ncbi:hypothetical protein GALMADRAFT_481013 [Galerina marginata CBS 339.88]|uniref:Zn(2)-C6 fungal-type domain-containing protein n=1 Tax=Galerina marginata (strain CBS 339.88) TaxID=685588 RepID=A0A067SZN3_GALM3|nr:hypothetical protein GALMADRAFT_481013 [Galerina marginata CBS 339.88]